MQACNGRRNFQCGFLTFCNAKLLDVVHLIHDSAKPLIAAPLCQMNSVVWIVLSFHWVPHLQRHIHTCTQKSSMMLKSLL
jgi:hypothetical protein